MSFTAKRRAACAADHGLDLYANLISERPAMSDSLEVHERLEVSSSTPRPSGAIWKSRLI